MRERLRQQLRDNAYPGYVYGYPHKKAYRPLTPRAPEEVWRDEPRDALFCYVHVPFCNQRCSFCNLFTFVPGDDSPADRYLEALARQMEAYARALGPAQFARLYIGGGTPTYLKHAELRRLAGYLRDILGVEPAQTAGCIEASPETVDEDKVGLLRELGFERLSLGIQSFASAELRHVNRRFPFEQNRAAAEMIGRAGFPEFNIDLIYGLPGQTEQSWLFSLEEAIRSPATSLFLYPLYVRPLTGLEGRTNLPAAPSPVEMGRLYDVAVARLAEAGFRQVTMRQFRRVSSPLSPRIVEHSLRECGRGGQCERIGAAADSRSESATLQDSPSPPRGEGSIDLEYRCQRDGMLGLGPGARSYTRRLHYSTPWKMVARNIRAVVEDFCAAPPAINHGFDLDDDEQRRRFAILSLLYDGLDLRAFAGTLGVDARAVFAAQWDALLAEECVTLHGDTVRLTARGVRHADVVGQLFFSERVRRLAAEFEYDR
jgi:oxygen-independent coproporphyrinogen-3 oxidase